MPKIRKNDNPEQRLQDQFREFLLCRDWRVMRTHGNKYQKGLPDLYCLHRVYGARWVEIKYLPNASITKAQMSVFTAISAVREGIWIVTECHELEYRKLHHNPNWRGFLIHPDVSVRGADDTALIQMAPGSNPEAIIQNAIMTKLRAEGCICIPTLGNLYQHGFPDVYVLHPKRGAFWIEVKQRKGFSFTPAQREYFPLMAAAGQQIYVITGVDDLVYLSQPANWASYMYGLIKGS